MPPGDGPAKLPPSQLIASPQLNTPHSRTTAARTDRGIIHVDRSCAWIQTLRVVVHTPLAVPVRIARLDIWHIEDLRTVLPERHVPGVVPGALVEGFHAEPLAIGNVFDRLLVGGFRILVVQVEVHGPVRTIAHIEGEERIDGVAAFRLPLEDVPPRWIAVWNVPSREVVPDAVMELGPTFGLKPAKQSDTARGDFGGIQCIKK